MKHLVWILALTLLTFGIVNTTFACPNCAERIQASCDSCYPIHHQPVDVYHTYCTNCAHHYGYYYDCCQSNCNQCNYSLYYVQAGAFRNYCNAVRQLEALYAHGQCYMAIYRLCNGLYAIRSTNLYNYTDATRVRNSIRNHGFSAIMQRSSNW